MKKVKQEFPFVMMIVAILLMGLILFIVYEREEKNYHALPIAEIQMSEEQVIHLNELVEDDRIHITESSITIVEGGIYRIDGEYQGGLIVDTEDDVTLVFDGVTIANENGPALLILNANDLVLRLEEGTTNQLSDGGSSEYDAALYSLVDTTFEGNGTLSIYGKIAEGIATYDADLTFLSGNFYIYAENDGMNAGGTGGLIRIDDGYFYIDAYGNGIDSNQDIEMNGGFIIVYGGNQDDNGAIDYDGSFVIDGGTLIAVGNGMNQAPDSTSLQNSLVVNFANQYSGNNIIRIEKNGEEILTFVPYRSYQTLLYSSADLQDGDYDIYIGGVVTGDEVDGYFETATYQNGEWLSKITVDGSVSVYKNV